MRNLARATEALLFLSVVIRQNEQKDGEAETERKEIDLKIPSAISDSGFQRQHLSSVCEVSGDIHERFC